MITDTIFQFCLFLTRAWKPPKKQILNNIIFTRGGNDKSITDLFSSYTLLLRILETEKITKKQSTMRGLELRIWGLQVPAGDLKCDALSIRPHGPSYQRFCAPGPFAKGCQIVFQLVLQDLHSSNLNLTGGSLFKPSFYCFVSNDQAFIAWFASTRGVYRVWLWWVVHLEFAWVECLSCQSQPSTLRAKGTSIE